MIHDPVAATSTDSLPVSKGTFTLKSLFVLVSCATAAMALTVPAVIAAREAARRASCSNNMKSLMLGMHNYEATFKLLPKSFQPSTQLSWTVSLIPYLESTSLFNKISFDTGPYYSVGKNDPYGLERFAAVHFLCPSSPIAKMEVAAPSDVSLQDLVPPATGQAPYTIHYYGISGAIGQDAAGGQLFALASPLTFEGAPVSGTGMLQWNAHIKFPEVLDGISNTICLGELSWASAKFGTRYRSWMHGGTDGSYIASCRNLATPINSHLKASVLKPLNNMPLGSQHRGGTNAGLGDGHVVFLSQDMDFKSFQALATRSGAELVPEIGESADLIVQ